jgi:F-type H+-transporting ATPase subunit a
MDNNPMSNEIVFFIGPVEVTRVVVVTWIVMAAIFVVAGILRSRLRPTAPGRAQQVLEAMIDWLREEIRNIIGRDPTPFLPLVGSLFLFILTSNLLALISSAIPYLTPPTANINTTAALALVVFLAVPFYGVAMTGTAEYLKTYVRPVWIMLPFNVLSELSRTVALAVRLFGNILSGEILFGVLLSLVPFLLPLPLMFLSLITGTIQAYIFTILAIVYIGGAVRTVERNQNQSSEDPAGKE